MRDGRVAIHKSHDMKYLADIPPPINMTLPPKDIKSKTQKAKKRPAAVAIKERKNAAELPTIAATGRGHIAEKILRLAFDNDIKVREDSALAEMLVQIDQDSPIPSEAFMAVAEILSYVYRADGKANPFDYIDKDAITDKV